MPIHMLDSLLGPWRLWQARIVIAVLSGSVEHLLRDDLSYWSDK